MRWESWLGRIYLLCHAVIISPSGLIHLSHLSHNLSHLLLTAHLYYLFTHSLLHTNENDTEMNNMMKYVKAMLTSVTKQQTQSRTVVLIKMPSLCLIIKRQCPNSTQPATTMHFVIYCEITVLFLYFIFFIKAGAISQFFITPFCESGIVNWRVCKYLYNFLKWRNVCLSVFMKCGSIE